MTAFHAPHLLILDEPTNHLDIDSREMLIHALADYEGAVILISHDRHLVEATADRLWIVKAGTVSVYDGDMEGYRAELLAERGSGDRGGTRAETDDRIDRGAQRRASAQKRQQLAPLKRAMQEAEKRVEKLSAELARIDTTLADPDLYADAQRTQKITLERGQVAKKLGEAEEDWLAATAAYEDADRMQEESAVV